MLCIKFTGSHADPPLVDFDACSEDGVYRKESCPHTAQRWYCTQDISMAHSTLHHLETIRGRVFKRMATPTSEQTLIEAELWQLHLCKKRKRDTGPLWLLLFIYRAADADGY